jgi:alpha-beta hydrolase superfamily lysophospholipase
MKRIAAVGVAAALVGVLAGDAQSAYRNPTAGASVVLQIPGMHRVQVQRKVLYRRVGSLRLHLDVYRPRGVGRARPLPAVLIGGPPSIRAGRQSGQKVGWAQLVAARGMAAVAFDIRSDGFLSTPDKPSADVAAALAYVRARGAALGIDGDRLCTLGFSIGTAPWHLWAAMKEPQPHLRCNAVYYGPLDLGHLAEEFSLTPETVREYSAITYLRRHGAGIAPMFVAKAGREGNPGINSSIDAFASEAAGRGAAVRVVTHEAGLHAFDVRQRTARTRAIMWATLAFFRARLFAPAPQAVAARPRVKPLVLFENCLTRAERRRAVRFTTFDRVRLIGVEVGSGPRAVILAHQGGGGEGPWLCAWMRYARQLAAQGYRVLAFDHRGRGSSGRTTHWARAQRVDFDVLAAIQVMRARGAHKIVLAGASLGGAAVLSAAALAPTRVDGVISFASPQVFVRVDALAASRALRVPALYVSAVDDNNFADEARALYEACGSPDKQLAIVPGTVHGAPVLRDPSTRRLVDAWIQQRFAS